MSRSRFSAIFLLALLAPASPLLAGTASLVLDINPTSTREDSGYISGPLTGVGDKVVFEAWTQTSASGFWGSDGTPEGTSILKDLCPGSGLNGLYFLGSVGKAGIFFVRCEDLVGPSHLWRSDGTKEGTVRLTSSLEGGPAHCFDAPLSVSLGGLVYFTASTTGADCELWRTDGTAAGTKLLRDIAPFDANVRDLTPAGNKLFFVARDSEAYGVWRTDGTPAGTMLVRSFPEAGDDGPGWLAAAGSRIFFQVFLYNSETGSYDTELWTSDGTPAGTRRLTQAPYRNAGAVQSVDGVGYFAASDQNGRELWRSDGTAAGTWRVTDFDDPAADVGAPIAKLKNQVLFIARGDQQSGRRLWSTQGTPDTTQQVPCAGACPTTWGSVVVVGDRAVFSAFDATHGTELWSTDGTKVELVRDLCPGSCSSEIQRLYVRLGKAFFLAYTSGTSELWRTDGTPGGTVRLLSARRYPGGINTDGELPQAGGRVYFSLDGDLWASNGTAAGTGPVALLGNRAAGSYPSWLAALGGQVLFTACDGDERGLWRSGGTPEATSLIPGTSLTCSDSYAPRQLTRIGNLVYYLQDSPSGSWLWRTDGTGPGTFVLKPNRAFVPVEFQGKAVYRVYSDVTERFSLWETDGTLEGTQKKMDFPENLRGPHSLFPAGSILYFLAEAGDFASSHQLCRTDGTPEGTRQLTFFDDYGFLDPPQLTRAGNLLFFVSTSGIYGSKLWRSDGTPEGTFALTADDDDPTLKAPRQLAALNGVLYFTAGTADGKRALWRSDGTPAGTRVVFGPLDLPEAYDGDISRPVLTVGQQIFFTASEEEHGLELWRTDGTAQGTRRVRDITPGKASSPLRSFTAAGGLLYFTAGNGEHGVELWQSDGTQAGTRMVQDIAPGPHSSSPASLTAAGDHLFFTADDGVHGIELWALPLAGPSGCQASDTVLCLAGGRFRVEAIWRDFQGNSGPGHAVSLTPDTGYFWFFDAANVEVILKVLDGQGVNGHRWVFYGALSTVEYTLTVTDTRTGAARRYTNPPGRLASVGDTQAFGPKGATGASLTLGPQGVSAEPLVSARAAETEGSCVPGPTRLCLQGGRFAVEARWKDFQGKAGDGQAVPLSGGDTGWFWFFGPDNVEVVLKVLDGRALNNRFWVFYGALSSVEYTLTVTDTVTGQVKTYTNPSGRLASVADTSAF